LLQDAPVTPAADISNPRRIDHDAEIRLPSAALHWARSLALTFAAAAARAQSATIWKSSPPELRQERVHAVLAAIKGEDVAQIPAGLSGRPPSACQP